MTARDVKKTTGLRIANIRLRSFDDGRGGKATDPVIELEDGSELHFVVQETDIGEYGIMPELWRRSKPRTGK